MEGMRHKLSLPGLGMSKCTDQSGAAGCRVCPERHTRLQSLEACARSRSAEGGRDSACMYIRCSIRVVLKSVLYGSRTNVKCPL